MKLANSHLVTLKNLQHNVLLPKNPKVVMFGAPNVGTMVFAQRLAIDLGVPAISMTNIYKNLLTNSETYNSELFYRKVIDLLKHGSQQEIQHELETYMIPEKLLSLTKYSEYGYVLCDYPQSVKQCEKY